MDMEATTLDLTSDMPAGGEMSEMLKHPPEAGLGMRAPRGPLGPFLDRHQLAARNTQHAL